MEIFSVLALFLGPGYRAQILEQPHGFSPIFGPELSGPIFGTTAEIWGDFSPIFGPDFSGPIFGTMS